MNELEQIHQLARVEAELLIAREELDVSAAALIEKPIEELIEISIRRQAILDLIHRAADESRRIADDLLNSACCQARDAVFNRKYALAGLKRYNESAAAYKKAIQIDPQNPLDVYSLGVIEEEQGNFKKAIEFYRQSIEVDPKFENGYFNPAAMHATLKQFDEAIAALKKLHELNPQAVDAKAMLREIEKDKRKAGSVK
ncbi:MAG TPA: tetratricopeptide repeat protein [Pyrinomonadaceae bacterium]|nr:tetratricopeptide repeat protein [Pyrinomonadaceae bacterium]